MRACRSLALMVSTFGCDAERLLTFLRDLAFEQHVGSRHEIGPAQPMHGRPWAKAGARPVARMAARPPACAAAAPAPDSLRSLRRVMRAMIPSLLYLCRAKRRCGWTTPF